MEAHQEEGKECRGGQEAEEGDGDDPVGNVADFLVDGEEGDLGAFLVFFLGEEGIFGDGFLLGLS